MAIGMTQAEYARKLGVSRQYVAKLVKMGRIRAKNGKVYPSAVKTTNEKSGEEESFSVPSSEPSEDVKGNGYWSVKTTVEKFNALLKRQEYQERAGILVRADEVQKVAFDAARKTRDALNRLPERLCNLLAAERDPEKIRRILEQEIRQIEEDIADAIGGDSIPTVVQ